MLRFIEFPRKTGSGSKLLNNPYVLIWGSVNTYDFPRAFMVTAFYLQSYYLEFVVNP